MTEKLNQTEKITSLRARAEALLDEVPADPAAMAPDEIRALAHELATHQIELEIQNEELREAQVRLAEVRDKYSNLYDYAPVAYISLNQHGLISEANLTACTLLGMERQTLLNEPFSRYTAPGQENIFFSIRKTAIEQKEKQTCELQMKCQDGTLFDAEITMVPFAADDGSHEQLRMTLVNITERKEAEKALAEKNRLNSLLLDSLPHPAMLIRKDRTVLAVNRLAREAGAKVGHPCWQSFGHSNFISDESKKYLADHGAAPPGGTHCHFCRMEECFGSSSWANDPTVYAWDKVWDTYWVALDKNTYLHYAIDVTVLRRTEEQLRQTEKMNAIGLLAGGIAHDLNNQLAPVLGYADMLAQKLDDEKLKKYAEGIIAGGRHCADRVQQLLAFARKGILDAMVPVDIHQTIREVSEFLKQGIDKRIRIHQHLDAAMPTAIGDKAQLQSIILNLALNAAAAMPNGGDLTFSTDTAELDEPFCKEHPFTPEAGRFLKIAVSDTGTGMNEDTQKRIFEPFFTTRGPGEGTGMGLASVYGSVERHKGTITVESEPEKGSTFTIYLPLIEAEKRKSTTTITRRSVVEKTARILLVDDEDIVREIAADMLSELGHKVTVIDDSKKAVEHYKESWQDIDLVIMDMMMPELSGSETFIAMHNINPDIKSIICSGYDLNPEVQELLKKGVMAFVHKPFEQAELSGKVAQVLQGEKALR
ncbi:MAG: PAS domain-containing hybrid sensor histidine kinase/response regulator [Planctomycetota bacterium]